MQETQARPLGREDTLEEGMATHSSILAWTIPMGRGAWGATVHKVSKSRTRLMWLSTQHNNNNHHNTEGHKEIFRGAGYVYYLDYDDRFMSICLCPNSSNCIH